MIERLQKGASHAVDSITNSRNLTATTVDQATKVSTTFQEIAQMVSKVSEMNVQISTAAEEQSAVASEINRNVTNINTEAEHESDVIQKMSKAGDDLARLTDLLQKQVKAFRY